MDTMITTTNTWGDVFTDLVNEHSEKAHAWRRDRRAVAKATAYTAAKAADKNRQRELIKLIGTVVLVVAMIIITTITTTRWVSSLPREVKAPEGLKKIFISEVVRPGDTIDGFVAKYMADESANITLYRFQDLRAEILRVNDIVDQDQIYAGQKIQIPIIVIDEDWTPEEEVNQ